MPNGEVRSRLMSRIRGSDTDPELRLRKRLWGEGLRYRLNVKTPGGRPDLTFLGPRIAVYVDGCFWHGCPDHYVRPRSRSPFWSEKLRENVDRDRRQTLRLEEAGWTVCRFWEHEIYEDLDGVVAAVQAAVTGAAVRADEPRWHVVEVEPLDDLGRRERREMEDLRDGDITEVVEQDRSTAKWQQPDDVSTDAHACGRTSRD